MYCIQYAYMCICIYTYICMYSDYNWLHIYIYNYCIILFTCIFHIQYCIVLHCYWPTSFHAKTYAVQAPLAASCTASMADTTALCGENFMRQLNSASAVKVATWRKWKWKPWIQSWSIGPWFAEFENIDLGTSKREGIKMNSELCN